MLLKPGDVFANRYEVERQVGHGGMGSVYRARDCVAREPVCLKVILPSLVGRPDLAERFLREGTLARGLRHRNIVAVFDVNEFQGAYFLTMEYMEGQSLRAWLRKNVNEEREVPLPVAVGIVKEILAGLKAAHTSEKRVVHRDVKPENVMLLGEPFSGDFRLKILDFGIARAVDSGEQLTGTGATIGTAVYMAPEQKTRAETAGPAADLYSVGVILYELLMEVVPEGRWELPGRVRPDLPVRLDRLCEKALNQHPRRRYQSAAEFMEDLEGAQAASRESGEEAERTVEVDKAPAEIPQPAPAPPHRVSGHRYVSGEEERFSKLLRTPMWTAGSPSRNDQGMLVAVHQKTELAFVLVPAGEFQMGGVDKAATSSEKPVHRVRVPAFLICATPCTQDAWERGGGKNESNWKGPRRPVEQVSWEDCRAWCGKSGLRLPSEAEWEYACRAGTTTAWSFGDSESDLMLHGWFFDNSEDETHEVGQLAPNPWGLFDVHGNVWEWCEDLWHETYELSRTVRVSTGKKERTEVTGKAPDDGQAWMLEGCSPRRVMRGGSLTYLAKGCRSAVRNGDDPDGGGSNVGFRPAASLP